MKNRILNGIEIYKQAAIKKGLTEDQKAAFSKELDMGLVEYCRFQELKSALAGSKLTMDEANTIYGFLGNTPDHFNKQSVEVKAVLTQVFSELIS